MCQPLQMLQRTREDADEQPTDRGTSSPNLPIQGQSLGPQPGPLPRHVSHQFDTLPATEALVDIPLGQVVHRPLIDAFLGCQLSFRLI